MTKPQNIARAELAGILPPDNSFADVPGETYKKDHEAAQENSNTEHC